MCARPLVGLWGHRDQCATGPALHTLVEEVDPQHKNIRCNKHQNQREAFEPEHTEDTGAGFCQDAEGGLYRVGP